MNGSYLLPVRAVVETMKGLSNMVILQAHLSSLPGLTKDSCTARIVLGRGQLFTCTIATWAGKVLLEQQQAYEALERSGDLLWEVLPVPFPHPAARENPTLISTSASGQISEKAPSLRVPALTPEILEPLANPYKRVILLVDGRRSPEEIAHLLSKETTEIRQMLASLPHLIQV